MTRTTAMPACLRRLQGLLEWMRREYPDATASLNDVPLGYWNQSHPVLELKRQDLFLHFNAAGGRERYRAISAHADRRGALIRLQRSGCRGESELRLEWRDRPAPIAKSRRVFAESLHAWARHRFAPNCTRSVSRNTNRGRSLSGSFVRIWLQRADRDHLILAPLPGIQAEIARTAITQLLLWVDSLTRSGHLRANRSASVVVPDEMASGIQHRIRLIDPRLLRISTWICRERPSEGWDICAAADISDPVEFRDYHWPQPELSTAEPALQAVLDLAPSMIRRVRRTKDYESLQILGLEFGRFMPAGEGSVVFGVGPSKTVLMCENFGRLEDVLEEILYYRRPDTPDPSHPYYRLYAERWLESLLLDNADTIFPEIAPGCIYSQVPVYFGDETGRVDLLARARDGHAIVLELKVREDPNMPLQSFDYRARVLFHLRRNEFQDHGFFPGASLRGDPPSIYLVAPLFGFHDSTERILEYLDPSADVWKIGLNLDWRAGVKVLSRRRLRPAGPVD